MVPVMSGSGNQLILCIRSLLIKAVIETVEHILRDQFHGRVELTGQDCVLLVESADLRGKRVDDVVRVGWNLSQNSLLEIRNPRNPIGLQGLKKISEKQWLVCGGHRVDTRHGLKLVQGEGAAEIRLHVRQSDGRTGIIEGGKHATCIIPP